MRVLGNFPFEMFGPREEWPFEEVLSFGPSSGRRVGDAQFDYDIPFDGGEASIHQLLSSLPAGFAPDAILLLWPDQEPIPRDLEQSPVPVIAIVSDYNLTLPFFLRSWPFFDLVLCDRPGLQVLGRMPFARVEAACQYSFRPDVHRIYEDASGKPIPRDIDISFVGNLNPELQRERTSFLERLRMLGDHCNVFVGSVAQGEPYGRMLSRSKIAFNRSIRGEMNLRAFEATACGALLFMERENTEVRDYFVDGEEVVLYSPDDLEEKLLYYVEHDEERERIAERGHARVQHYRLANLLGQLPRLISEIDVHKRPRGDVLTLQLGRGELLMPTWCNSEGSFIPLGYALRRAPHSPLVRNQIAVSMLWRHAHHVPPEQAFPHFAQATQIDPEYLPAHWNLYWIAQMSGNAPVADTMLDAIAHTIEKDELSIAKFDGLMLPLGFSRSQREQASAWCETWRTGFTDPLLALHRDWLARERARQEAERAHA
jgi:hypothetical protein